MALNGFTNISVLGAGTWWALRRLASLLSSPGLFVGWGQWSQAWGQVLGGGTFLSFQLLSQLPRPHFADPGGWAALAQPFLTKAQVLLPRPWA